MEAAQRYDQVKVDSRVMLVLGGRLPEPLRRVVGLLKIEFRENVTVPADFKALAKGTAASAA